MNDALMLTHVRRYAGTRAQSMIAFVETDLREWFEIALGLTLDRQKFTERVVKAWLRGQSIEGVTLDPIPLAWAIESAAGLDLTPDQRMTLREDVGATNERILQTMRALKAEE